MENIQVAGRHGRQVAIPPRCGSRPHASLQQKIEAEGFKVQQVCSTGLLVYEPSHKRPSLLCHRCSTEAARPTGAGSKADICSSTEDTHNTYHPHHHADYRYSIHCSHLFIELELFIATERQSCLSPRHPLYLHSIAYSLHTSTPSSALGAQSWTSSCPLSSSLHISPPQPQTSATP